MATQNKLKSARGTIFDQATVGGAPTRLLSPWDALLAVRSHLRRVGALRRSRRALLDLSDEQLRDIGITREDARREGRRSFYLD